MTSADRGGASLVPDIERHGAIGDRTTLALIDDRGSINWMCWPRFDSPSLFGRLLDPDGGHWSIEVDEDSPATVRQLYLPGTNVLITRLHHSSGIVELIDHLAVGADPRGLVRSVHAVRGDVRMRSRLVARPDYGRSAASLVASDGAVRLVGGGERLLLSADVALEIEGDNVVSSFTVGAGETMRFCLAPERCGVDLDTDDQFDSTVGYWRRWSARMTYTGRWREMVERSALALGLLTDERTGGVLAAGTTSLPEVVGGSRNWDYRYVWVRDAAFAVYALSELGYRAEADAFTSWVEARVASCEPGSSAPLSPLYDLDGNESIPEQHLEHWQGYRDSRPVRIGNGASDQVQMDIYGEVIDSLYLADKYGNGLSLDVWRRVVELVDWVCDHWREPGQGMWEARVEPQRFTMSLVMCWVAVERAVRMARRRGRPADFDRWLRALNDIHRSVVDDGWSDDLESFTQTLGGDTVDASLLLMPLVRFVAPDDPRWLSTLDRIGRDLTHDALVDRYDHRASPDGLDGDEGSFTICSFWFCEALARAGRVEQARTLFDKLLTYSSPLGLFSEQIGPSGRQIGNYPQAFTHLSLISAAIHLDEALDTNRAAST